MRRRDILRLLAAAAVLQPASLYAQSYPDRALTMVVPFPAGGATDVLARVLSERLKTALGQTIVVENVAGAAGSLALGRVMRAPADGYTLSIGTSTTHMLTGGLYNLPLDLLTDLDPIVQIGSEPLLIVAKKDLPANNLKELIAWLKANPDKASVGIPGIGATGHLAGILFEKETGTKFQSVPYKGNAPAMQDLASGQIDFMIQPSSNFLSLVRAGTIKALAVTSAQRVGSFPDVPTTSEAGLSGFEATIWYGLWIKHGAPAGVVDRLNAAMRQTLEDPTVREKLTGLGMQITPPAQQTPAALAAFQKAETQRWWPIIKAANIKPQ